MNFSSLSLLSLSNKLDEYGLEFHEKCLYLGLVFECLKKKSLELDFSELNIKNGINNTIIQNLKEKCLIYFNDDKIYLENIFEDLNNEITYKVMAAINYIDSYIDELKKDVEIKDIMCMNYSYVGVNLNNINVFFEQFYIEQKIMNKTYTSYSNCKLHFIYWMRNNVNKIMKLIKEKECSMNKNDLMKKQKNLFGI